MVTMRDVAKQASVSVATVSHVINGTRFVDPQTVDRVRHAIDDLGYRPNILARGLRRNETSTIGMVVPDNFNPFFAEVVRSIEDVGFESGYNVILCNSDGSEAKEIAYVETLLSKQVDGLVFIASGRSTEALKIISQAKLPCVVVDREVGDLTMDQVLINNTQGGYLAAQYLAQLGHRRIGYIAGPRLFSLSARRITGFQQALAEVGIQFPDDYIVQGDFNYRGGEEGMRELLRRNLDLTAVFASNDRMAIGCLNVLLRAGLRVPEDVSLMGYDDIPQTTAMFPALTTVAQPKAEMGRTSVSLLLERIRLRGEAIAPRRVILPVELVLRESCGPPREGKLLFDVTS